MKTYDPPLSKDQVEELVKDLYNTKVDHATIECRFQPQFKLLDKKGEIVLALKEIFPNDFDSESIEKDLEFEYDLDSIKISSKLIRTESYFSLTRAFIHRENIIPTTLAHFSKIGITHLETYEMLLKEKNSLERIGYRIRQRNRIPDEKIKSCKNNFSKEFLNIGNFTNKLKSKNVNIKFNDYAVVFNLQETIRNNDKISDYFIRLQINLSSSNDEKSYLNTDMDFYIKNTNESLLFENAIIFCKRVAQRADEIHKIILEVITNV